VALYVYADQNFLINCTAMAFLRVRERYDSEYAVNSAAGDEARLSYPTRFLRPAA
jgi:hypothetical protein